MLLRNGAWVWVVLGAALAAAGCGDDDGVPATDAGGTPADSGGAMTDSGAMATDGGAMTGDGGGGATDGGGPATDAGGSMSDAGNVAGDGGGVGAMGCAMGGPACAAGLMCCSGVPYPMAGICAPDCPLDSDRAIKTAIRPVDPSVVLEKLAALPISEWSYRSEHGVRHVGPMAQDFHAAFGLGESDRVIHPVDASGVTMAALQALYTRLSTVERDNRALRDANDRLTRRVHTLERR